MIPWALKIKNKNWDIDLTFSDKHDIYKSNKIFFLLKIGIQKGFLKL